MTLKTKKIFASALLVLLGLGLVGWPRWQAPAASQSGPWREQVAWMRQALAQGQANAVWEQANQGLQESRSPDQGAWLLLLAAQAGLALADQGQAERLPQARQALADAGRLGLVSPQAWNELVRLEAAQTPPPPDLLAWQEEFVALQARLQTTPADYPVLQARALELQRLLESALAPIRGQVESP